MSKLKPCPFCGGEAKRCTFTKAELNWVECSNCGASTERFFSKAYPTRVWNRRVSVEEVKHDAMKWISVKERLPEEYTKALVVTEDGKMLVATYTSDGWMYPCYGEKPTHWMPLPEPPEVEE